MQLNTDMVLTMSQSNLLFVEGSLIKLTSCICNFNIRELLLLHKVYKEFICIYISLFPVIK